MIFIKKLQNKKIGEVSLNRQRLQFLTNELFSYRI